MHFKELALMIWRLANLKPAEQASKLETRGRVDTTAHVRSHLLAEVLLPGFQFLFC